MTWRPNDPQGDEAGKIKHLLVPYTRGTGLDIGCGVHKAFPHFLGVDAEDWRTLPEGNDIVADGVRGLDKVFSNLDFVFSSHFLEHVEDTREALRVWWSLLRPGGFLVLYLPHQNHYPRMGEEGANPDHKHDFVPDDIIEHMRAVVLDGHGLGEGATVLEDETRTGGREYSFFQVYQKRTDGQYVYSAWRKPERACLVIRYGAFGDALMAASVLPGLKEQGWHITFNTTPRGHDILREDPNIDLFLLQDQDQVPNNWLGTIWEMMAERFDHVVNLSASVEGTLLPEPGNPNFIWPLRARQRVLGSVNYLERQHEIAGVPFKPAAKFYASEDEEAWAREYRGRLDGKTVMVALAGSAAHKVYPYWDIVVGNLLAAGFNVVTTGGATQWQDSRQIDIGIAEYILRSHRGLLYDEARFERERKQRGDTGRYRDWIVQQAVKHCQGRGRRTGTWWPASGDWSIRQTLTFARHADCVIGPETGVLNAVAFEPGVAKVVMLSHSSHTNLTRDWRNTTVLEPFQTPCFPCHRMHHSEKYCFFDKDGRATLCTQRIYPDVVLKATMLAVGGEFVNRKGGALSKPPTIELDVRFWNRAGAPPPEAAEEDHARGAAKADLVS